VFFFPTLRKGHGRTEKQSEQKISHCKQDFRKACESNAGNYQNNKKKKQKTIMIKIGKNFGQLLLIAVTLFSAGYVTAQEKSAMIHFENKKHDFGQINPQKDSIFTTTFVFENKGNVPLVIQKVTTSCGCTVPEWTTEAVESGRKGNIKIIFNSKGYSGKFSKSIFVKSNAEEDVVILRIEGFVKTEKNKSKFKLFN
jgi:hypothetical protein